MKNIIAVINYTKNLWPYMLGLALGSVLVAILSLGTPFIVKYATDEIVNIVANKQNFDLNLILILAVTLLAITLAVSIINDVVGYYGDMLAIKLKQQLSNRYYSHLLKLPQTYYDEEIAGKIINRLNRAIENIARFINAFSNNLLQMLITIIISVAIMFFYNWMLGLLIVILFPTYIWLTGLTSGKWQRFEKEKNFHYDIASGRFNEVITQMRLVKSFGSEGRELRSFKNHFSDMVGITSKQSFFWHKMNSIRGAVLAFIFFGVYFILFYDTAKGLMTIGDMVLLTMLVQRVVQPLSGMSFFVDMYQRAAANSKDYVEAMQVEPENISKNRKPIKTETAEVRFDSVDFSYHNDEKVLHGISFDIKPGKKLALVGESGGGKSTIANLLMNLYTPDVGDIYINKISISKITLPSLRQHIATVFQDAGLFSGTIRENISYGNPGASEESIVEVAKAANAYDFISKYRDGLDTEIGERGVKLSGGQKQRIAIARALLKDAPILILDEATSSLDSKSEVLVQDALDRLMRNRTVLIIAHRLSTIANVDTIVTLMDGHIDEIGTPSQLSKSGGVYSELLKLQTSNSERAKKKLKHYDLTS